jgi:NADPH-dependent F420 reductase
VKIGIVGGTGDIGEGMALRLSQMHNVVLGSRDESRAVTTSECTITELRNRGLPCSCEGFCNQDAVDRAGIVILAVPYSQLAATIGSLHGLEEKLVVCPVNPMERGEFFMFVPPAEGSAAMLARRLLPSGTRICTAFNTIAANKWKNLDDPLDIAVPVCGDDAEAKKIVMDLAGGIGKIHPYDAGPLAASSLVEGLTPLLLNIARYNRMRDVGIQFR